MYALDLAYKSLLYVAQEDDPISGLLSLFSKDVYRVAVVDSEMKIKGIVSANNILRILLREKERPVSEVLGYTVDKVYEPALTLPSNATVYDVVSKAVEYGMVHFVLVDPEGHVRGLITEGTIIRRLKREPINVKARDIMTSPPVEVSPYSTIYDATETLANNNIKRVLLTGPGGIYGYYSSNDVVRWIARRSDEWDTGFSELARDSIASHVPRRSVFTIDPEADVSQLAPLMRSGREEFAAVMGPEGVVGVVTERDMVVRTSKIIGVKRYIELLEV